MTKANKTGLTAAKAGGTASAAKRAARKAKHEAFLAFVERRVAEVRGREPDPVEVSLIDGLGALYAQVLKHSELSGGVNRKVSALHVSAVVTGLKTTLRELGVLGSATPDDPNEPPGPNATPEERAAWSRRYVAGLMAEGKGPTQ
jgi:hypothetical protein